MIIEKEGLKELRKDYLISRIEKIIGLMEKREENILFQNQNIFRHHCILEKMSKEPSALNILYKKEKQWLKIQKDNSINHDNIYIFIADTLSELINKFPTNKNIKRAVILSYELLAIKIMLYPIYKNKEKIELIRMRDELLTNPNIKDGKLKKIIEMDVKLNPELHKFVKNWTRSITFDIKVKMTTFVINMITKVKDVNKNNVIFNEATKRNEVFSTREEVFTNISERLLEYSLNNLWLEEFKFLSARLINKNPQSYSRVILKKRILKGQEINNFESKIRFLLASKNTYLSSDYKKYDQIFYNGINHGLSKLNNLRGVDYHTARIVLDIFIIESLKSSQEDKPYLNYKAIESSAYYKSLIYGLKPYSILRLKIRTMNGDFGRGERRVFGGENLLEIIKETLRVSVLKEEDFSSNFNNLKIHKEEISIDNFYDIFLEYAEEMEKRKEVRELLMIVFSEIEKEMKDNKKNIFNVLSENQKEMIKISLLNKIKDLSCE